MYIAAARQSSSVTRSFSATAESFSF